MTDFIIAVIFLLLAVGAVVLRKTYYSLPAKELKRRAARRDRQAAELYRAVAYGGSLNLLLWLLIGVASAVGFVLLARVAPVWLSLLAVVLLLWLSFAWLPGSRVTSFGRWLTARCTPAIAWVLGSLHPFLSRGVRVAEKRVVEQAHTGLFERGDLLDLIERQQDQPDSRLTPEELEIVKRALSFSDYKVRDVLVPWRSVKTVAADDTIGPVLIDELHRSAEPFVPVTEGSKSKPAVVGMLNVHSLGIKSSGQVRGAMDQTVYYLHEDDSLAEALHAFSVTNHPLFIVVNGEEACVGILTIESILQQLLGHIPGDDYEQYADLPGIAARHKAAAEELDAEVSPMKESTETADKHPHSGQTVVE